MPPALRCELLVDQCVLASDDVAVGQRRSVERNQLKEGSGVAGDCRNLDIKVAVALTVRRQDRAGEVVAVRAGCGANDVNRPLASHVSSSRNSRAVAGEPNGALLACHGDRAGALDVHARPKSLHALRARWPKRLHEAGS